MAALTLPRTQSFGPRRDALETRLHHLLDQFAGPAVLVMQATGRIVAVNTGAVHTLGRTRANLLACALPDLWPPAEVETWWAHFATLEAGQTRQLLGVPHLTPDQHCVWVDWRLTAWREASQVMVLAHGTPTADRLAQDEQDRQLEHLLQLHHELAHWLTHPQPPTPATTLELLRAGYGADAAGLFINQPSSAHFSLAEASAWPAAAPRLVQADRWLSARQTWHWVTGQRLDGHGLRVFRQAGWQQVLTQPLDASTVLVLGYTHARPLPHAGLFLPLTARHWQALRHHRQRLADCLNQQAALSQLQAQWLALHTHALTAALTLDAQGAVSDLNPAASALLGYQPAEVTGLPVQAVLNPDDATARFLAQTRAQLTARQRALLHHRHGTAIEAEVVLESLPDGGTLVLIYDLSPARHEQLRREQLDHLAYVGQSTQAFAHEVRAPLNNIAMGMQFLAARLPADETMRAHFGKIQTECQRLSDLMNDMLAWTKPLNPQFAEVDLAALLNRLLLRWGNKLNQRRVQATFTAEPHLPLALADANLLERVFVNLIENALHVMPHGGDLSVSLSLTPDQQVQVKIGDSGPGIPEDVRKRIFDPYFTTRKEGTGLGLAICKRLVTIHHGAIAVESYPGVGSIFTVTLPARPLNTP